MFDIKLSNKDREAAFEDISGWFKSDIGGPYLGAFQKMFANKCGSKYAFGVSSGSSSIYVALRACGIGPGSHVAVPAYTHIGSVAPIVLAGASPVFVDVDKYGNLDPSDLKEVSGAIHAVIVVHQLGLPCRMDEIKEAMENGKKNFDNGRHRGFIIEDASHALGAEYKWKSGELEGEWNRAGCLGDVGCFSIGGGRTKTIGVGEGGMVVCNDDLLAEKIKNIRNHGDRYTDIDYFCFNFRMSDLNAAVGLMMIDKLDMLNDWQIKNAEYIIDELPDYLEVEDVEDLDNDLYSNVKTTRYIVGCRFNKDKVNDKLINMTRDGFLSKMGRFQVGPRKFVGAGYSKLINDVQFYKRYDCVSNLENSRKLIDESIWIDYHRYPRSREEIDELLDMLSYWG